MYLLYSDESNLQARGSTFFVYGGLAIPTDAAAGLSAAIEKARARAEVPPEYLLKFSPGPRGLDNEGFKQLKAEVLGAAGKAGCKMLVSLILHGVATSPEKARRFEIGRALYHFDCFLNRNNDHGLVLVDRFSDRQIDAQLRARFAVGVVGLPYSPRHRLSRILGFHYSCIGQSHFASLTDIAIGSFRFAVDALSLPQETRIPSARALLAVLSPLFCRESGGRVSRTSLHFSPVEVRAPRHEAKYDALKASLSENGLPPE